MGTPLINPPITTHEPASTSTNSDPKLRLVQGQCLGRPRTKKSSGLGLLTRLRYVLKGSIGAAIRDP